MFTEGAIRITLKSSNPEIKEQKYSTEMQTTNLTWTLRMKVTNQMEGGVKSKMQKRNWESISFKK
jgi:hypothetical protein